MIKALIYDIEILKGICGSKETKIEGIEYCDGWKDHANMGISVIGAYEYATGRPRVFCLDNKEEFRNACLDADLLVGFNNIPFDNAVIKATWWGPDEPADHRCYDILREVWAAAGLPAEFNPKTHGGYGLDAMCEKNFGIRKSGNGALAPVDWQRGNIGAVIDYCLNDVFMTKRLFDEILLGAPLKNPRGGPDLKLRIPL